MCRAKEEYIHRYMGYDCITDLFGFKIMIKEFFATVVLAFITVIVISIAKNKPTISIDNQEAIVLGLEVSEQEFGISIGQDDIARFLNRPERYTAIVNKNGQIERVEVDRDTYVMLSEKIRKINWN